MNFELYGDDSQAILKLDPRTKMAIFVSSCIVGINSYNFGALIVYDTMLCLVFGLAGKRWPAVKAFLAFAVAVLLRVCTDMQGVGNPVLITIVQMLILIFLFAFPFILSLLLLIQTTRISQFLAAFQHMKLPAVVVIPVAVLFRFIPTVQDEWAGINKAMAFRGIELNFASVVQRPMQAIEHLLVPLLMSSISVMEELAAAAEARGLDADHRRTSYEEVHMGIADYLVIVIFIGMALFILFGSFQAVLA